MVVVIPFLVGETDEHLQTTPSGGKGIAGSVKDVLITMCKDVLITNVQDTLLPVRIP